MSSNLTAEQVNYDDEDRDAIPDLVITKDVQFIPLYSCHSIRNMRKIKSLQRIYHQKREFIHRTQLFVRTVLNKLVNDGLCVVHRREGFDNRVTYRIHTRNDTLVRVAELDWKIILEHLRQVYLIQSVYEPSSIDNARKIIIRLE